MKIALQITTATLGDMVIEETDEKTTTNPDDQKAIVVELLTQAIAKVVAAYKIPKSMLDMGDTEYETAHARKVTQDKEPRYSSAEANRQAQQVTEDSEEDSRALCSSDFGCNCNPSITETHTDSQDMDDDDDDDENEDMIITEQELDVVNAILNIMRGKNV